MHPSLCRVPFVLVLVIADRYYHDNNDFPAKSQGGNSMQIHERTEISLKMKKLLHDEFG